MITNIRVEMDDEQRNKLARLISRSETKSLATRKDVTEFVMGCIAAVDAIMVPDQAVAESYELVRHSRALCGLPPGPRRRNMSELIYQARTEDAAQLRGKTDGFVVGWCKVKYAAELRGDHP